MEAVVLDIKGKDTGRKVSLTDAIYAIEPNNHAVYLDVKQYLANQRQGTHKSKERAEITGSTRKIKKQKGTGTARAGSIKSPVFRGGGRVFGPRPRNYSFKLNKKLKSLARKSAFSIKAKENAIVVMENVNFDAPKTSAYSDMISNLGFNPMNNGEMIIISVPALTEERRRDLAKQAKAAAEDAKVGIRNARKDANNDIKKTDDVSEDEQKSAEADVQTLTDKFVKKTEDVLLVKEKEIMTV